jgi:hypothetical protein
MHLGMDYRNSGNTYQPDQPFSVPFPVGFIDRWVEIAAHGYPGKDLQFNRTPSQAHGDTSGGTI